MEQILNESFRAHTEPVWVLEVRPDHDRWLGSNEAADTLLDRLEISPDNLEVILGHLGVPRSLIMGGLWSLGSFSTSTDFGLVHATKLHSEARPPLMVVSLHTSDEAEAWRQHNTMVLSLRINEEVTNTMRMTQLAVAQMEGVVGRLQTMLHDFNHAIEQGLRGPQQLVEGGLTLRDESRQG